MLDFIHGYSRPQEVFWCLQKNSGILSLMAAHASLFCYMFQRFFTWNVNFSWSSQMASSTERFSVASQRCARSSTTASPASSDQRMKQTISYNYGMLLWCIMLLDNTLRWQTLSNLPPQPKYAQTMFICLSFLQIFCPCRGRWVQREHCMQSAVFRASLFHEHLEHVQSYLVQNYSKIILIKHLQNNVNNIWSHLALPNQPQNSSYQLPSNSP